MTAEELISRMNALGAMVWVSTGIRSIQIPTWDLALKPDGVLWIADSIDPWMSQKDVHLSPAVFKGTYFGTPAGADPQVVIEIIDEIGDTELVRACRAAHAQRVAEESESSRRFRSQTLSE